MTTRNPPPGSTATGPSWSLRSRTNGHSPADSAAGRPPAVVLGGTITGLSVARSLADAGVDTYVLDKHASPARNSRLITAFVEVAADQMQQQMLDWLRTGPSGAVVLAGNDEGLELIARNRAELEQLGYLPMEADDEVLLAMLDKERTRALAMMHDIPMSHTWPLQNQADVDRVIDEVAFPCVLKPVHSHVFARATQTGAKVVNVQTPAQLQAKFDQMSALGVEMAVIEVVTGPDDEYVSYYSYLDDQGQPLLQLTKRKIRQNPPRFGIGTYHATTHDPEVAELGLRFFQAVGLRGLGNVEFKRDGRDGQLKLIECNPRFTMSNELIRQSGVDLALFAYNRLAGRPTPAVDSYRDDLRLWDPINDTRAFLAYRRRGEMSFKDWAGSLCHPTRFPVARLDDPLPAVVRAGTMVSHVSGVTGRSSGKPTRKRPPLRAGLAALTKPLANKGRRGRELAARLDVVGSVGPGYVWRRVRAEGRLSGLGEDVRHQLYERIWKGAAEAERAEIERLAPGLLEISRDGAATRVFQQVVELDDPVTLRVALDKAVVHRMLGDAGVITAEHVEFDVRDPEPALEFLAAAGGPCVVKPAAGTGGGHGTTTGVTEPAELIRATLHASKGSERLLIERQAPGDVYRLLFLDGELLDVVHSRAPRLTGDGTSTIERLIAIENERRIAARGAVGLSTLGINLDMLVTLERTGLSLSSVVGDGETFAVRTITNNNSSSDNETYRGPVAPEIVAMSRDAVETVGLRLAGVDVITTDLSQPLTASDGIVAEVNGTPGIHHHYLVADIANATPVARPILQALLSRR